MPILTTIVLIIMFLTPTISVLAMMLQGAEQKQAKRTTNIVMVLFAVGIHLLGARGLLSNLLNLGGSSLLIVTIITTVVTLLLGWAIGLLVQDLRQPKP